MIELKIMKSVYYLVILIIINLVSGIYFTLEAQDLPPTPINNFNLTLKKNIIWQAKPNADTYSLSIYSYDIDNDGKEEIISGGWFKEKFLGLDLTIYGELRIYDSTLGLKKSTTWTGIGKASKVNDIKVYDIDNDGELEIIVLGRTEDATARVNGEIRIYNPDLELEKSTTWTALHKTGPFSLHIADIDNDGKIDLVTVSNTDDLSKTIVWAEVRIFSANLESKKNVVFRIIEGSPTEGLAGFVKDIDKDGKPDIIVGGHSRDGIDSYIRVYTSKLDVKGTVTWQNPGGALTEVHDVYAGDIDMDGDIEIIAGGYTTINGIKNGEVMIYNSNLEFNNKTTWMTFNCNTVSRDIDVSDIDNDGELEIISSGYALKDNAYYSEIRVYDASLNLESNAIWQVSATDVGENIGIFSSFISDIDNDGIKEILSTGRAVISGNSYGQIRVYTMQVNK